MSANTDSLVEYLNISQLSLLFQQRIVICHKSQGLYRTWLTAQNRFRKLAVEQKIITQQYVYAQPSMQNCLPCLFYSMFVTSKYLNVRPNLSI